MKVIAGMSTVVVQKIEAIVREHAELGASLEQEEIASDSKRVREISIRRAEISPAAEAGKEMLRALREVEDLEGVLVGKDKDLADLARLEIEDVKARARAAHERAIGFMVQGDDLAVGSVMVELRAGTGGDEAALWTRDLMDVYSKYSVRQGWSFELLDMAVEGATGGVRHAVVNIKGNGVWNFMSFEAGVHSVKRVPATESQGRVHTSTATVAVLAEPTTVEVKIDWANDVEEFATTSQGPGGQNVNKVATAVQIKHKATGIIIRMQESKSQQDNRQRARRLLMAKLFEIQKAKAHQERAAARQMQIGSGERSEKIRTYRYKDNIAADERLTGEYGLREILAGKLEELHADLLAERVKERVAML